MATDGDAVRRRHRQTADRRARYTFVDSAEPNGVQLGTYENRVVGAAAIDTTRAISANYYFYGHKLKLQSGVQVAEMDDRVNDGGAYSGISWTTGVRVSW